MNIVQLFACNEKDLFKTTRDNHYIILIWLYHFSCFMEHFLKKIYFNNVVAKIGCAYRIYFTYKSRDFIKLALKI